MECYGIPGLIYNKYVKNNNNDTRNVTNFPVSDTTRMPFIRRQPPACFDLVDCCDLDLDPLTFISDVDLDMIVTYLHAKN